MKEELIYRRDCDLFTESMDYESVIHDLMTEYNLTWHTNPENDFDEDKIYEFARELLRKAQNVIDTANTIAYEKDFISADGVITTYLTYSDDEYYYT